jgi:hypothetical protein
MRNGTQAIVAGVLSLAVIGCDAVVIAGINAPVIGSGRVVSEMRPVSDVREVVLSGVGRVVVVQGRRPALVVTAEDNLMPLLTTHAAGSRLTLSAGEAIRPRREIVYHLTVRDLDELVISGAGDAELTNLSTEFMRIVISGSGTVAATGYAVEQRVLISGDGRYFGEQLESRYAQVEVSGAGYAVVWVRDVLDALVSGSGLIEFYGRPVVRQAVSGSGAVLWRGR